jgi:hypothetical protein
VTAAFAVGGGQAWGALPPGNLFRCILISIKNHSSSYLTLLLRCHVTIYEMMGVSEELKLALVASREAGRGIYAGKLGGLDRASPHDHHLAAAVCTS